MNKKLILLTYTALIAAILTFCVIGLGAFTRLTHAGPGCPDWPGCYGRVVAPTSRTAIQKANKAFPEPPVEVAKAWYEMTHRYLAGVLGLVILLAGFFALTAAINQQGVSYSILAFVLMVLLAYQVILGMWTVTMKLMPFIVSQHLLVGMNILALMWLLYLKAKQNHFARQVDDQLTFFRPWIVVAIVLMFLQLATGAWTSTNYAALSCPGFPGCLAHGTMTGFNFKEAFNLFSPVGANYEGGHLDAVARMTIHMTHRLGALIVFLYLSGLFIFIIKKVQQKRIKRVASLALLFLFAQLTLGVLNVYLQIPLIIAVMHNLMAALLLMTIVALAYRMFACRFPDPKWSPYE